MRTTDELRRLLTEEPDADAEAIIAELGAHGTPLITDDPGNSTHQRILLSYVAPTGSAGVYAWANRLTDGTLESRGQLRRWGSTDLWLTELTVARGTMATYRFYPYCADDENLRDGQLRYSRAVATAAVSDPTNPSARPPFGSVLRTDGAPDLAHWDPRPAPAARPAPHSCGTVGDSAWRLTAPVGGGTGPTRLVVMFDAHKWFDEYDLPAVLASSVDAATDPIALLGIDAPRDASARLRQLGPNRDFLQQIVTEVAPRARQQLGIDSTTTIWAGQSLGGAAALAVAAWFPDAVDEVLAYSPSMWWKPGMTARPTQLASGPSWLATTLADAPPCRIQLAVGRNEDLLFTPVTQLAQQLRDAGWPVTLQQFNGGHDIVWWAHLLHRDIRQPNLRAPIRKGLQP